MEPETSHVHKITYGPLIDTDDTALYVMCLMGENPLLGPLKGLGHESLDFHDPSNGSCNVFAPIKHITNCVVSIIGA